MKIIDMPRGTGKTWNLAKISNARGIPIITDSARILEDFYKDIFPNATFMTYTQYLKKIDKPKEILIDEFPFLMKNKMFPQSKILAMTYSSEDMDNYGSYIPFVCLANNEE